MIQLYTTRPLKRRKKANCIIIEGNNVLRLFSASAMPGDMYIHGACFLVDC